MAKFGIEISETLSVSESTTPEQLAEMLVNNKHTKEQVERAIRIYGKFQAKKVREKAIELVQTYDGLDENTLIGDIQNINV